MNGASPSACPRPRLVALGLVLLSTQAIAHGAYPQTHTLAPRAGSATHVIAETTFGMLLSADTGATWSWICEEAVGTGVGQHAAVHFAKGGDIWAGSFAGLFVSRTGGCDWAARPEFVDSGANDITGLESEPAVLYATTGKYGVENKVFRSSDSGASFQVTSLTRAKAFFSSVRVAPSNPQRIYVAAWWFEPMSSATLFRSDDGSGTFSETVVTAKLPTAGPFRIWAVHPTNPDVFFASVDGTEPSKTFLLRTEDAGATFVSVFEATTVINGVSFSDDGQTVWAATSTQVHRSSDGGKTFAPLPNPQKNGCIGRLGPLVFACGWPGLDGWAVGKSSNGGDAFTPSLTLEQVKGPLACEAGSGVAQICTNLWPVLQAQLTAGTEDAGTADAGTSPADGGTGPKTPPRGCGCSTTDATAGLIALCLVFRRRRALVLTLLAAGCTQAGPLVVPELIYAESAHWPRRADYPGVGKGRLVVTNSYDDTVSLFDLEQVRSSTFGELRRIPVGLNPVELEGAHHAAIDPKGEYFYVGIANFRPGSGSGPHGAHGTGTIDGYVLKLRASDNVRVGQVRVDPNPGDVVVSPDGRRLYLSHFNIVKVAEVAARGGTEREMDARLAVIDAETMTRVAMVLLCPAPHGLRFSPDGKRLYAACYSDEVAVVQLDDPGFPVQRVKIAANAGPATAPVYEPYGLTVSPTTGGIWVSSLKSNSVQVLDPITLQPDPSRRVSLLGIPFFGAFTADGTRLYLPERGNERLVVVEPTTGASVGSIALPGCQNAHQVLLVPDGLTALVVCEGNQRDPGALLVLDLANAGKVLRTLPLGVFPDYVGVLRSTQ